MNLQITVFPGYFHQNRSHLFIVSLVIVAILWNLIGPVAPFPVDYREITLESPESPVQQVPEGLTAPEWNLLQSKLQEAEYQFSPVDQQAADYLAANRAHGWTIQMDEMGVTLEAQSSSMIEADWEWGLTLTGYGYSNHVQTIHNAPILSASAGTLAYSWDSHLTEWYRNDASGLEQGFILTQPPSRGTAPVNDTLTFEMSIRGNLIPLLTAQGQAILLLDETGKSVLKYDKLWAVDSTSTPLPAWIEVDAASNKIRIYVDASNAVYPILIDPLLTSQTAKMTASDGSSGDEFGTSVAVSGNLAIVGAPNHSSQGAAYIFERNQGGAEGWGQVAKLMASDGAAGDAFGSAVALHHGIAVVGAPMDDAGAGVGQGSVYIFERNLNGADAWGEVKRITAPAGVAGNLFGSALDLYIDHLIIGAPGVSSARGAAFIYERNTNTGDNWGRVVTITTGDLATGDQFGHSVSIDDEVAVVGAPFQNSGQGAAYFFYRNQTGADAWGFIQKHEGTAGAQFGYSVSVSLDSAAVGAPNVNSGEGTAYIFERNTSGDDAWGQVVVLAAGDGAAGDQFGGSISLSLDTVVVGAQGEGSSQGAAYVFERNANEGADNWGHMKKIVASDGAGGDQFGVSVALDLDTAIVGAPSDDSVQGSAYSFTRTGTEWPEEIQRDASDATYRTEIGWSVAVSGDVMVAGAPGDPNNTGIGAVYIFYRNLGGPNNWGEFKKIPGNTVTDVGNDDQFGFAVALDGDTLVVSATFAGDDEGRAYVFERNAGGVDNWGEVTMLSSSSPAIFAEYGWSVDIHGDTIVVGAVPFGGGDGQAFIYERNFGGLNNWGERASFAGGLDEYLGISVAVSGDTVAIGAPGYDSFSGSVHILERNFGGANNWGVVTTLTNPSSDVFDQFGWAVDISGDRVAVGTPGDNGIGIAYVFERNQGGADAWGQIASLSPSDPVINDTFGWAVALDSDTLVVGARYTDNSFVTVAPGKAYIFERNYGGADAWDEVVKLTASDADDNDRYGNAVAISGSYVVVGAYRANDEACLPTIDPDCNSGSTYIYHRRDGFNKPISGPGSYSLGGDTQVLLEVTSDGGCLTGVAMEVFYSDHPNATTPLQTGKHWNLTPTGCSSGFNLTMTIGVLMSEFGTLDSNDKVCRYTGSDWDCEYTSHDNGDQTLTRSGVTQLSTWTAGNNSGPTAVEMEMFTARSSQGTGLGEIVLGLVIVVMFVFYYRKDGHRNK